MSFLLATTGIVDVILSAIGSFLYPLFSVIFFAIDAVQAVFSAFAGIGNAAFNTAGLGKGDEISSGTGGGEVNEQGLVYYLMHNDIVKNLLISIAMLALVLIIVFTVMAFLKNMYAAKQKNWKEIIGLSIKGLANFIFLPVCCLLGVWLGNILLQAINGATSNGGATQMSRKLFVACAYNANRIRITDPKEDVEITFEQLNILAERKVIGTGKSYKEQHKLNLPQTGKVITADSSEEDIEYYANLVDSIYSETDVSLSASWGFGVFGQNLATFYSLFNFNYLILIVGGVFMLYVLGALSFAMVRRMFYILVLFVVSPALCAMYPLDEGSAVKSWSGEFKKQVLSAYGAIAGMNIFFSLLPLIENIQVPIAGVTGFFAYDEIIQLFIMVSGLMIVKELMSLISGFAGGEDAYGKGTSLMKASSGAVKKYGKKTVDTGVSIGGAFVKASAAKKAGGSWWGSMGGSLKGTADKGLKTLSGGIVDTEDWKKKMDEAKKSGTEHPNPKLEKKLKKYNEQAAEVETKKAKGDVDAAIQAAGGKVLSDDAMAAVLKNITNKEAKSRAAAMIAAYNNKILMKAGKGTTTAEKVLESEEKVKSQEANRQELFYSGQNTETAFDNAKNANAAEKTARLALGGSNITYNASTGEYTGTGLKDASSSNIESLKIQAASKPNDAVIQAKLKKALEARDSLEKHKKAIEEQERAVAEAKRGALEFVASIEKIAEDYKDNVKSDLKSAASKLKNAVHKPNATAKDIETALDTAKNDVEACSTELKNILRTGSR